MSCPNGYEKTSNGCILNCKPGYSSDGIDKCYRFCVDAPISDNYCTVVPCPNGGIFNPVNINQYSYSGTCSGPGISTYPAQTKGVGGGIPDIYTRDPPSPSPRPSPSPSPRPRPSPPYKKKVVKKVSHFTNTNNSFEYYVIFVCLMISIFLYFFYLK